MTHHLKCKRTPTDRVSVIPRRGGQVGTLDLLVGLSEDLGKLDAFVEQVMKKVSNYQGDVLEDQRDKLSENLLANGGELLRCGLGHRGLLVGIVS